MDGGRTSSRNGRVIVLSRDSALVAAVRRMGGRMEPVFVPTAYEAAAEILTSSAAALVLDLRLLGPRHGRLLEIAREKHLEMLAVGALAAGMTTEDLNGIRLVARGDLVAALKAALDAPCETDRQDDASERPVDPPRAGAVPIARQDDAERRMREAMAAVGSPEVKDTPAAKSDRKAGRRIRPRGGKNAAESPGAADRDVAPESPGAPDALLTPEEINALLGKQS
jgi:hypothetical protein